VVEASISVPLDRPVYQVYGWPAELWTKSFTCETPIVTNFTSYRFCQGWDRRMSGRYGSASKSANE